MGSVVDENGGAQGADGTAVSDGGIPLFRARSKAKEFRAQLDALRTRVDSLGILSAVELEERKAALQAEVTELDSRVLRDKAEAVASVERATADAQQRSERAIAELESQQAQQIGRAHV